MYCDFCFVLFLTVTWLIPRLTTSPTPFPYVYMRCNFLHNVFSFCPDMDVKFLLLLVSLDGCVRDEECVWDNPVCEVHLQTCLLQRGLGSLWNHKKSRIAASPLSFPSGTQAAVAILSIYFMVLFHFYTQSGSTHHASVLKERRLSADS